MNKRKIVIDLIMANSCNRRCDYCPINFNGEILNWKDIDFIIKYLDDNNNLYDECTINFFWGEPLINFENVKYFININRNNKIRYTIWTNWILLTEEKLDFFIEHNVKIYLTFHADDNNTYKKIIKNEYLKKAFSLIQINFIVSPINLCFSYEKIDKTIAYWFKIINIIPVMLTIKWDNKSLVELNRFINYVDGKIVNNISWVNVFKFSYFDWIPVEIGFVIDTDLSLYQDSSDELFIWKQFSWLWEQLSQDVEDFTLLWNIKDNELSYFIWKYDIKNIVKMLYSLPEKLWYLKDYIVIYRIMNSDKNKRSNMWGNVYNVLTSKIDI